MSDGSYIQPSEILLDDIIEAIKTTLVIENPQSMWICRNKIYKLIEDYDNK